MALTDPLNTISGHVEYRAGHLEESMLGHLEPQLQHNIDEDRRLRRWQRYAAVAAPVMVIPYVVLVMFVDRPLWLDKAYAMGVLTIAAGVIGWLMIKRLLLFRRDLDERQRGKP